MIFFYIVTFIFFYYRKIPLANVAKFQSRFDHHNLLGLSSTNNNMTQHNIVEKSSKKENEKVKNDSISSNFLNGDNKLVDISQSHNKSKNIGIDEENTLMKASDMPALTVNSEPVIKPLTDINVNLQDIKPGI